MSVRTGIKLTEDLIKSHIAEVIYEKRDIGGHMVIHCHFKMDNGFIVYGKTPSTSIDPANFDERLGKEISYNNTFDQLWELEAYRALVQGSMLRKLQVSDINIFDYMVSSSPTYKKYDLGGIGNTVDVAFLHPRDKSCQGIVVSLFLNDEISERDKEQNQLSKNKVIDYLLSHMLVEDFYTDTVISVAKAAHEASRVYHQLVDGLDFVAWGKTDTGYRKSACELVCNIWLGRNKEPESTGNKIFATVVESFR